ncbi:MAG: methyltransferase domain-containing protein [Polyangiaceae bacterium]|nr:methyltransferase domain-containing protein [Polyangiaceae bacterium]
MKENDFDYDCYSELNLQRLMVADRPRTVAFADAIFEATQQGNRVIDAGAGTGLLAMLAARAGAGRVHALERASIARYAEQLVKANRLGDTVEVIRKNAADYQAPEPVDLIVSEWLGHFAFTEAMVQKVMACRDKNLRPGGKMLPARVDLLLAPVESEALYIDEGPGFWDIKIRDIDFSSLEEAELNQAFGIKTMVQEEDLLAAGQPMVSVDMVHAQPDDLWAKGTLVFQAQRAGSFHGFAGWFFAQLSDSYALDTAPGAPLTHWRQTYFPFHPRAVEAQEEICVEYKLAQHPVEPTSVELTLQVDDEELVFTVN